MPGFIDQVRGFPTNALLRPGADDTYADGDDSTWMSVDWTAITHPMVILGRRMNVIDTGGDKPPLLFLHGLGGIWQNWLLNIPAFMDTHRVVAPDLPGFGRSEMPSGTLTIQGLARTIDALCRELGLENPVVVGNSMGGFVGAELALAFPTRVQKLVLASAAGLSVEKMPSQPLVGLAKLWSVTSTKSGARSDPVVKRPRLRRVFLQTIVRYPEKLSVPLATELVAGSGTHGFAPGLKAVLTYKFSDRLVDIEVPVLIVWGRNDILIPAGDAHEYERLIGDNARAVVFEDTGHLTMLERPSRFNELLREFIAGDPTPESDVPGVNPS